MITVKMLVVTQISWSIDIFGCFYYELSFQSLFLKDILSLKLTENVSFIVLTKHLC